jgi:GntR family transcriptional repressor for pyruvate dehydrogenase complex
VTRSRPTASALRVSTRLRDHSPAPEHIIAVLREQILSGELPRGSRLPSEKVIGEHFAVSAPTVREAIRALGAMGLTDSRHGSGTYVTASPEDLVFVPLATAAQLLNLRAAELAIENATADDIARLASARDLILAGKTRDPILSGVESFLRALSEAAHQPLHAVLSQFLIRVLVEFERQYFPCAGRFWRDWTGSLADVRAEIVDALRARDRDRMTAAVRAYHGGATLRLADSGIDQPMKLANFAGLVSALSELKSSGDLDTL